MLVIASKTTAPISHPEPVLGRFDIHESHHITFSGLRELLYRVNYAVPHGRVQPLQVVEHTVTSRPHGSPETKLPLQILSGDPIAQAKLSACLGQAAVLVVGVGLIVERSQ